MQGQGRPIRRNKGLKRALVFFILLSLGLSLYIVDDKTSLFDGIKKYMPTQLFQKKQPKVIHVKIDDTKDWIYNASYDNDSKATSYTTANNITYRLTDIRVPYLNINSDAGSNANEKMKELYEEAVDRFNDGAKDKSTYAKLAYQSYTIDRKVLSVVVAYTKGEENTEITEYTTYNFDLKTGNLLSIKDAYDVTSITEKVLKEKTEEAIKTEMTEALKDNPEAKKLIDKAITNFNSSLNSDSIPFFIDNEKNIRVVVKRKIADSESQTVYKITK